MVWSLDNPVSGPYKMMGHPIKFTKTPIKPTSGAPALGQHTAEVLKKHLGYKDEQIAELKKQKVVR
jgi:crotonobetainyl-CoA:carnitine CoA-transferase CaiB-like acyl-CoA transferase